MTKVSKPKVEVTTYHMSLHLGAVLGPVRRWKKLVVGDKLAWEGEVTDNQIVSVSKPDLFGGLTKDVLEAIRDSR